MQQELDSGPRRSRTIQAVVFDVGETLVNETLDYHAWADWLGVPRHTFSAVFGAVVAADRPHKEVFEYFKPGFDLAAEWAAREAAGNPETYGEKDLYPDARRTMAALREAGYLVVIAAQPDRPLAPHPGIPEPPGGPGHDIGDVGRPGEAGPGLLHARHRGVRRLVAASAAGGR